MATTKSKGAKNEGLIRRRNRDNQRSGNWQAALVYALAAFNNDQSR
jgi:hypothetical protein